MDRTTQDATHPDGRPDQLVLELLGGVFVSSADGRRITLSGRPALIAAVLGLSAGPVSTEHLIDTLWSEVPNSGRNALQRHVARLRRTFAALGVPDAVRTIGRVGYELDRTLVRVDVDDLLVLQADQWVGVHDPSTGLAPRYWLDPLAGFQCDGLVGRRRYVRELCSSARLAARQQGIQVADADPFRDLEQAVVPQAVLGALSEWLRGPRSDREGAAVRRWLGVVHAS